MQFREIRMRDGVLSLDRVRLTTGKDDGRHRGLGSVGDGRAFRRGLHHDTAYLIDALEGYSVSPCPPHPLTY